MGDDASIRYFHRYVFVKPYAVPAALIYPQRKAPVQLKPVTAVIRSLQRLLVPQLGPPSVTRPGEHQVRQHVGEVKTVTGQRGGFGSQVKHVQAVGRYVEVHLAARDRNAAAEGIAPLQRDVGLQCSRGEKEIVPGLLFGPDHRAAHGKGLIGTSVTVLDGALVLAGRRRIRPDPTHAARVETNIAAIRQFRYDFFSNFFIRAHSFCYSAGILLLVSRGGDFKSGARGCSNFQSAVTVYPQPDVNESCISAILLRGSVVWPTVGPQGYKHKTKGTSKHIRFAGLLVPAGPGCIPVSAEVEVIGVGLLVNLQIGGGPVVPIFYGPGSRL